MNKKLETKINKFLEKKIKISGNNEEISNKDLNQLHSIITDIISLWLKTFNQKLGLYCQTIKDFSSN